MEIKLDHLLPAARDMALLSAEQRVAKLQSDYWIGYSRAERLCCMNNRLMTKSSKMLFF